MQCHADHKTATAGSSSRTSMYYRKKGVPPINVSYDPE